MNQELAIKLDERKSSFAEIKEGIDHVRRSL